jgi:predicted porin
MNFKKTALVLAMAGIVGAPMVAQADDSGFYGSVRQALVSKSNDAPGSDTTLDIANMGSRFGVGGETDLGNGMTGFGKYEFGVNTDGGNAATVTRRKAYVGLKGDFGSVLLGQNYHTFYNFVNAPVDIANWNSGFYAQGRTDNAITYAGGSGAVNFGLTANADSSDDTTVAGGGDTGIDSTELGASYDAGVVKIAAGMISYNSNTGTSPESLTGLAISGNIGEVYVGLSMQSQDKVADSTEISASMGPVYVAYGVKDLEGNADGDGPSNLTLGYSMSIGPQTDAWFEYTTTDSDLLVANVLDTQSIEAVLKYSW